MNHLGFGSEEGWTIWQNIIRTWFVATQVNS